TIDLFQRSGWWEYGNYVGSPAVVLTLAGIVWVFAARKVAERWLGISLAGTIVLALVLSGGEFSRFAPASLAAHVPFFSSFRIPSRYTIAVVLAAAATI